MSDARIDDLVGKVAHELLTSPRARNNFGNMRVYRRVRFRSSGPVGYGPTMWVKSRSGDILRDHVSKACQRIACQLCWRQHRYHGRGMKRTISCSLNEADQ